MKQILVHMALLLHLFQKAVQEILNLIWWHGLNVARRELVCVGVGCPAIGENCTLIGQTGIVPRMENEDLVYTCSYDCGIALRWLLWFPFGHSRAWEPRLPVNRSKQSLLVLNIPIKHKQTSRSVNKEFHFLPSFGSTQESSSSIPRLKCSCIWTFPRTNEESSPFLQTTQKQPLSLLSFSSLDLMLIYIIPLALPTRVSR